MLFNFFSSVSLPSLCLIFLPLRKETNREPSINKPAWWDPFRVPLLPRLFAHDEHPSSFVAALAAPVGPGPGLGVVRGADLPLQPRVDERQEAGRAARQEGRHGAQEGRGRRRRRRRQAHIRK